MTADAPQNIAPQSHKHGSYEYCKIQAQSPDVADRLNIAQSTNTPAEILFYLAMDNSKRVREAVAKNPATPLQAHDILKNTPLTEEDAHDIIQGGDAEAITALLANDQATIAVEDLDFLIDQAAGNEAWHKPLVHRPNLSFEAVKKIALFVCSTLLKVLLQRNKIDETTAAELIQELNARISSPDLAQVMEGIVKASCYDQGHQSAYDKAQQDFVNGNLTEDTLDEALFEDEAGYVIEGIAIQAGVSAAVVEKAVKLRKPKMLVALCWKAHLSMRFAVKVQQHLARIMPPKLIHARNGVDYPMKEPEMLSLLNRFAGLVGS